MLIIDRERLGPFSINAQLLFIINLSVCSKIKSDFQIPKSCKNIVFNELYNKVCGINSFNKNNCNNRFQKRFKTKMNN